MTVDYAERARALVGTRYRLQGRGRDGLDCIGVLVATFGLEKVPQDYRLRGHDPGILEAGLSRYFRKIGSSKGRPGDVMLMSVAVDQLHVGVRTAAGFVHAHAGIRRVVETPGVPELPIVSVWRRRSRCRRG